MLEAPRTNLVWRKKMKMLLIGCLFAVSVQIASSDAVPHKTRQPMVIPFFLDSELMVANGLKPQDDAWFELTYSGSPDGKIIHEELAERVWWVQEQAMLMLGATGLALPGEITSRATIYLHVFWQDTELQGSPFELFPKKNGVFVGSEHHSISQKLAAISSIDASYLSQVSNFLANNLSTLDVQGTSYSVSGYGPVINALGQWTGEPTSTAWTYNSLPADFIRARPGGIASSDATLNGNFLETHVNLGFVSSVTGDATWQGSYCTVSGGRSNTAYRDYATVGGGKSNIAKAEGATVSGGIDNEAYNGPSTIGGGQENVACGIASGGSTVGGGLRNYAGSSGSTISGGAFNQTTKGFATVCGGQCNVASGTGATVSGGQYNFASGDYSWAGGQFMHLSETADGTFVWGQSDAAQTITIPNSFLVFPKGTEGNLGIRTAAPAAPLHVGAGPDAGLSGGGYLILGSVTSYNTCFDENEIMARNNGTTSTLYLNPEGGRVQVGGDFCYTGSIGTCSDRRYKKDIQDIPDALERVSQIKGVGYHWKREEFPQKSFSDQEQIGFIAQDLKEVLPQAVSQDDDGYYCVDYSKLTPLLVEAIKDLNLQVKVLSAKNLILTNRMNTLELGTQPKEGDK